MNSQFALQTPTVQVPRTTPSPRRASYPDKWDLSELVAELPFGG